MATNKLQPRPISTLLTQADLAALLVVTEWTIWAMRRRGELPAAVRVGRALRWRPEIIEAWLESRERPAEEFDAVLCQRAAKAVNARGQQLRTPPVSGSRRGRPTKVEKVEGRR